MIIYLFKRTQNVFKIHCLMRMNLLVVIVIIGNAVLFECSLSPTQRVSITDSLNKQKEITNGLESLLSSPTGLDKYISYGQKVFAFGSSALPALRGVYQGIGFIRELTGTAPEDPVMRQLRNIQEDLRQLDRKLDSLEQVIILSTNM